VDSIKLSTVIKNPVDWFGGISQFIRLPNLVQASLRTMTGTMITVPSKLNAQCDALVANRPDGYQPSVLGDQQ
jgi:hypothetical protein